MPGEVMGAINSADAEAGTKGYVQDRIRRLEAKVKEQGKILNANKALGSSYTPPSAKAPSKRGGPNL